MKNEEHPLQITDEDKQKYERLIKQVDLAEKDKILKHIPQKITSMMETVQSGPLTRELIEEISKLYTILKNVPELDDYTQKSILFALKYFDESEDEIPDDVPEIGYLDDAVLVHWIVERTLEEFSHIFEA